MRNKPLSIITYGSFTLILIGFSILIVFLYRLSFQFNITSQVVDLDSSSKVGDYIGGVIGSLWTLASTLLFFTSLMMQRDELTLQRKSIEQQQSDIARNFELSNRVNFEGTLFSLINQQETIVLNLTIGKNTKTIQGSIDDKRDEIKGYPSFVFIENQFKILYRQRWKILDVAHILEYEFSSTKDVILFYRENNILERFERIDPKTSTTILFSLLFYCYHDIVSHYFRHTYYIFKYINKTCEQTLSTCTSQAEVDATIKQYSYYAKLASSRLSIPEMVLLFYNGLLFPKLGALLEKYDILSPLVAENLIDSEHKHFYNNIRFDHRNQILIDMLNEQSL